MADYPNACGSGEDMKVDGNSGFGTSSPTERVHVYNGNLKIEAPGSDAKLIYKNGDGNEASIQYDKDTNGLEFRLPTISSCKMFLSDAGRLGIGTTNPGSKLEVDGGDIEVDDNGRGLILRAANSARYLVYVDNDGNLKTSLV